MTTNQQPIHFVRRWSGVKADETPVCGADPNDPKVWGNRSQYTRAITCRDCLKIITPKKEQASA